MRVGNLHDPQAGVDVTKIPTERQTQSLRRHSDPISLLRIRNLEGDGRSEEEAPDNATTDDEDDYTERKKQVKVTQLRMPRKSTTPSTLNPTTLRDD